jgi:hypothetical protein
MGPAEVSSENRRSSGLLKKPLTGCSKRSRGEAREKSILRRAQDRLSEGVLTSTLQRGD